MDETEDKLSIVTMIGDYRDWVRLGMKSIDIGVYQKWINKNEAEVKIVKKDGNIHYKKVEVVILYVLRSKLI